MAAQQWHPSIVGTQCMFVTWDCLELLVHHLVRHRSCLISVDQRLEEEEKDMG